MKISLKVLWNIKFGLRAVELMILMLVFVVELFNRNLLGCLIVIPLIVLILNEFKLNYSGFININRKWLFKGQRLSTEEIELVEDTKKLIKSIDSSIEIADFNVYRVRFGRTAWHYYDQETKERNVFIPFKLLMRYGKNFAFLVVVHEVLHSQNLKNNIKLFKLEFLEGLNELLSIWLVRECSDKYQLEPVATYGTFIRKQITGCYWDECLMVAKIIQDKHVELNGWKEIFLKYIECDRKYFEGWVPSEHML